jgi:hypothetical protein
MPGVHQARHRIAARLRFLLNLNGYGWAARGALWRYAHYRECIHL